MAAEILDGKAMAAAIRAELEQEVRAFRERTGVQPTLAIVRAGEDPGAASYARQILRACERVGMAAQEHVLPADVSTEDFAQTVARLSTDAQIHGILLQEPYPAQVEAHRVVAALEPSKDVDGVHPLNAGRLLHNEGDFFVPATALGGLELLKRSGLEILGRRVVVVGRSNIVGKPMALLLLHEHATVTMCHSRTRDLGEVTREADILAVAVGQPRLITGEMVRPGAVVLDFGINFVDGRMVGDVDFESVVEVAGHLTPVPGGTGPMTNAMLLRNLLTACRRQVE
jgi:methylenetetrahydrofolate dehydrogenase (NADP+)/methenyltetrahydrofolate cyclohydrolase